jgi:hypothetical protein
MAQWQAAAAAAECGAGVIAARPRQPEWIGYPALQKNATVAPNMVNVDFRRKAGCRDG